MFRILHCLGNRLTDGGKVVSPTHRPHSALQKLYFSASGTNLCRVDGDPVRSAARALVPIMTDDATHLPGRPGGQKPLIYVVLAAASRIVYLNTASCLTRKRGQHFLLPAQPVAEIAIRI
jgi:hypothetical protein